MLTPDGKYRLTDVANTETLLRLIQSIPKAEPFGKQVITSKTPSNWVEPKNLGLRNHD